MFENEFRHVDKVFSEGFKLMTQGVVFFGFLVLILASLTFLFPTFVGLLVAVFMLSTGLIALALGYRCWKIENSKNYDIKTFNPELEFSKIRWGKPIRYHFRTIRFNRW